MTVIEFEVRKMYPVSLIANMSELVFWSGEEDGTGFVSVYSEKDSHRTFHVFSGKFGELNIEYGGKIE
ncbi:MAG TPA: hypothetical protein VJ208_00160 [Candidatus Nanoarchaeia archaeon]|nr:hypothetical protein [Candidatus Nanoarchaeia archaeon]